jgi:hypothetical protein
MTFYYDNAITEAHETVVELILFIPRVFSPLSLYPNPVRLLTRSQGMSRPFLAEPILVVTDVNCEEGGSQYKAFYPHL